MTKQQAPSSQELLQVLIEIDQGEYHAFMLARTTMARETARISLDRLLEIGMVEYAGDDLILTAVGGDVLSVAAAETSRIVGVYSD